VLHEALERTNFGDEGIEGHRRLVILTNLLLHRQEATRLVQGEITRGQTPLGQELRHFINEGVEGAGEIRRVLGRVSGEIRESLEALAVLIQRLETAHLSKTDRDEILRDISGECENIRQTIGVLPESNVREEAFKTALQHHIMNPLTFIDSGADVAASLDDEVAVRGLVKPMEPALSRISLALSNISHALDKKGLAIATPVSGVISLEVEDEHTLRIGIPHSENTEDIEHIVYQQLEAMGARNIAVIPFSPAHEHLGIVQELNKRGRFGLIVDTTDVGAVRNALSMVISELELVSLTEDYPALATGNLHNADREVLLSIATDPRLYTKYRTMQLNYIAPQTRTVNTPSNLYRFSDHAKALDAGRPRVAAIPSALLENDPLLRTRIMNRRRQMHADNPIQEVLVITDPRITEANYHAYLEALGVEGLFDRRHVILYADIAAYQGIDTATLDPARVREAMSAINEEDLQGIIREIANRNLSLEISSEDIAFVGGVPLFTQLIRGILEGVGEGEEAYYEMLIERLTAQGDLDPAVAARLRASRDQIFSRPDAPTYRDYEQDIQDYKAYIENVKQSL